MTSTPTPPVDAPPEIQRLARVLEVEPHELDFLSDVGESDLRTFREQVTDTLFDAHTPLLRRLATAAKLLPAPVSAKIAQSVFGPLLCARISGELEPDKAGDVAKRLPVDFLTDVAVELDPRRVRGVLTRIETDTIRAVASELASRQDWITLGRFVGHLEHDMLQVALSGLDDAALLSASYTIDDVAAVPAVLDLLDDQRRRALVHVADTEGLWPTLLELATHLRDDQRAELADLLVELDASALHRMLTAADEHRRWSQLLPLVAQLPTEAQELVASAARELPHPARSTAADEAQRLELGDALGPIAVALRDDT